MCRRRYLCRLSARSPVSTTARQVGVLARTAGGDITLGHAVPATIAHQVHLVTTIPDPVATGLPTKCGINVTDRSSRSFQPGINGNAGQAAARATPVALR